MKVDSRKFLSVGLLLLISTLAVNGATAREATIVKDVSFKNNGDSLEAKITAGEESKFTYFELTNPASPGGRFSSESRTRSASKRRQIARRRRTRSYVVFHDSKSQGDANRVRSSKNVPYRVIEDGGGMVRIVFGETARAPQNQTAGRRP